MSGDADQTESPVVHEHALGSLRRDWEELAESDPLWAILSDPLKRGGRWTLSEFFGTGAEQVDQLLELGHAHGYPKQRTTALDFGCGVGRLTRALAKHFETATGVDISAGMVERAQVVNSGVPNIRFLREDEPLLPGLGHEVFDLVVSMFVLQHFPSESLVRETIAGLASRVSGGGMLIIQLPTPIPLRHRLQVRPRVTPCCEQPDWGNTFSRSGSVCIPYACEAWQKPRSGKSSRRPDSRSGRSRRQPLPIRPSSARSTSQAGR